MSGIDMSEFFDNDDPWSSEIGEKSEQDEISPINLHFDEQDFISHLESIGWVDGIQKLAIVRNQKDDVSILYLIKEYATLSPERIAEALAGFMDSELVTSIYDYTLSKDIYEIDVNQAITHQILPIEDSAHELLYLLVNPFSEVTMRLLSIWARTKKEFSLAVCCPDVFDKFVDHNSSVINERITGVASIKTSDEIDLMLRHVISEAIKKRASDIRLFPIGAAGKITFRIDGDLVEYSVVDADTLSRLCELIESERYTTVDETNRNIPRTGSMRMELDSAMHELRCSFIPTQNGHDTNLRFLYAENMDVTKLGLSEKRLALFRRFMDYENGLIFFTGPTGSGKSTSLYSLLEQAKDVFTVCCVEDPVEHRMPGLVQVSLNEDIGYVDTIKAFLRHDPDIIVVGETRVAEVAAHVITCANTGHLTFSTLHTNNALSAIARLRDLKISNIDIADNIKHIVSQILVKRVCPECSELKTISTLDLVNELEAPRVRDFLKESAYEIRVTNNERRATCKLCEGRGTIGRCLATEILNVDSEIKQLILQNSSVFELRSVAYNKQLLTREEELMHHLTRGYIRITEAKTILGEDSY